MQGTFFGGWAFSPSIFEVFKKGSEDCILASLAEGHTGDGSASDHQRGSV